MSEKPSVAERNRQARLEFWRLLQWFGHRYSLTHKERVRDWDVSGNALRRWSKGQASAATMLRAAVGVLRSVRQELLSKEDLPLQPTTSLSAISDMVGQAQLRPVEAQAIRAYTLVLMQDQLVQQTGLARLVCPKVVCEGDKNERAVLTTGISRAGRPPDALRVGLVVSGGYGVHYVVSARRSGDTDFERRGRLSDRSWTQVGQELVTYFREN